MIGPSLALPAQELGDRGAEPAWLVGIDLGEFLDRLDRRLRIGLVLQERAAEPHDAVGPGAGDEIPAFRQRAVVARRHDQVLAAFAAVGTGHSDVDDPAEPVVVDGAEKLGRRLQDHGALGEIEDAHDVDRVRVGRQEQRLGIHQLGEDEDLVVLDPDVPMPLGRRRCSRPAWCP